MTQLHGLPAKKKYLLTFLYSIYICIYIILIVCISVLLRLINKKKPAVRSEIPKKMHLICRQLTEISPDFWAACSFDKVQIIIMVKAFFVVHLHLLCFNYMQGSGSAWLLIKPKMEKTYLKYAYECKYNYNLYVARFLL